MKDSDYQIEIFEQSTFSFEQDRVEVDSAVYPIGEIVSEDKNDAYVCFDIETTGLDCSTDQIIEIGAIKVKEGKIVDTFNELIYPKIKLPWKITSLTGITDEMLVGKPEIDKVLKEFIHFTESLPLIAHNISFDYGFIKENAVRQKLSFEKDGIDTLYIARTVLSDLDKKSLEKLCAYFGIENQRAHRASHDALATAFVYQALKSRYYSTYQKIFAPKQLQHRVKKESPITEKQISFLLSLLKKHNIHLEKEVKELTRSEASKTIDKIILQYGKGS